MCIWVTRRSWSLLAASPFGSLDKWLVSYSARVLQNDFCVVISCKWGSSMCCGYTFLFRLTPPLGLLGLILSLKRRSRRTAACSCGFNPSKKTSSKDFPGKLRVLRQRASNLFLYSRTQTHPDEFQNTEADWFPLPSHLPLVVASV